MSSNVGMGSDANGKKGIDSLMSEGRTFAPPADIAAKAHVGSIEQYQEMYDRSINDSDAFVVGHGSPLCGSRPEPALAFTASSPRE